MEEDIQPLTEPIISTNKTKNFDIVEKTIPNTTFDWIFFKDMMNNTELIRNVILQFYT